MADRRHDLRDSRQGQFPHPADRQEPGPGDPWRRRPGACFPQCLPAPRLAPVRERERQGGQAGLPLPPVDLRAGWPPAVRRHRDGRRLRHEGVRPEADPGEDRRRLHLHQPGGEPAGHRRLPGDARALHGAVRHGERQGGGADHHPRSRQLEAGDREQPRVLPLQRLPPGTAEDPAGVGRRHRPARQPGVQGPGGGLHQRLGRREDPVRPCQLLACAIASCACRCWTARCR